MPQKPRQCKGFVPFLSSCFTTNPDTESVKAHQNLLTALRDFYWLKRTEPLNFTFQYPEVRRAFNYRIGEFNAIYTAYNTERGVV